MLHWWSWELLSDSCVRGVVCNVGTLARESWITVTTPWSYREGRLSNRYETASVKVTSNPYVTNTGGSVAWNHTYSPYLDPSNVCAPQCHACVFIHVVITLLSSHMQHNYDKQGVWAWITTLHVEASDNNATFTAIHVREREEEPHTTLTPLSHRVTLAGNGRHFTLRYKQSCSSRLCSANWCYYVKHLTTTGSWSCSGVTHHPALLSGTPHCPPSTHAK